MDRLQRRRDLESSIQLLWGQDKTNRTWWTVIWEFLRGDTFHQCVYIKFGESNSYRTDVIQKGKTRVEALFVHGDPIGM